MILEGLGVPFSGQLNGKDTYGTFFSARTDLHLDLVPDGGPLLYQHGFDPDILLSPVGRWQAIGTTAAGVRVRATLDPKHPYYDQLVDLIQAGMLDFSPGSSEHSVRIDRKTGEILSWPLWEISLTPTASNMLATLEPVTAAMRAAVLAQAEAAGAFAAIQFLAARTATEAGATAARDLLTIRDPRIRDPRGS